jgi:hypothetical protein
MTTLHQASAHVRRRQLKQHLNSIEHTSIASTIHIDEGSADAYLAHRETAWSLDSGAMGAVAIVTLCLGASRHGGGVGERGGWLRRDRQLRMGRIAVLALRRTSLLVRGVSLVAVSRFP